MANYDVKNLQGAKVGEIDLDDGIFGAEVNEDLLWEVVKWQQARSRAGTHSTLRRDEVRGGGKKPFKQKGTGNARQGSSRAPQFVGGGSVFGPKPRDYDYALPKKVRAGALRSALSLRARDAKLIILDSFALDAAKTKRVAATLVALGVTSALIVDEKDNVGLARGVRNLARAKFLAPEGLNVYDVLKYETLVLTRATIEALHGRLRPGHGARAGGAAEAAVEAEGGAA